MECHTSPKLLTSVLFGHAPDLVLINTKKSDPAYQTTLPSYSSLSLTYSMQATRSFLSPNLQTYSHLGTLHSLFLLPGMLFLYIIPFVSAQRSPSEKVPLTAFLRKALPLRVPPSYHPLSFIAQHCSRSVVILPFSVFSFDLSASPSWNERFTRPCSSLTHHLPRQQQKPACTTGFLDNY